MRRSIGPWMFDRAAFMQLRSAMDASDRSVERNTADCVAASPGVRVAARLARTVTSLAPAPHGCCAYTVSPVAPVHL